MCEFKLRDFVYYKSCNVYGIALHSGFGYIEEIKESIGNNRISYAFAITTSMTLVYINNLDFPKDTIRHATEIERLLYG